MRKAPIALLTFAAGVLLVASGSLRAQTPQPQATSTDVVQQHRRQMNQIDQMLRPLNITPDQEERIQAIYDEMAEERQAATRRLRLAHRALSEAIQSPTPNEALIEQRSKEVSDAQATTIRLRSLTEARILQVLTQEQRMKLRQLRAQAQTQRRNQQNQRGLGRDQNALRPNQTTPLTPRQRRLMRQQQQQRPQ
ncbi:MAG: Spy/CpxP family protein refolding chaperone [Pyrinomonadaceae bacterium]